MGSNLDPRNIVGIFHYIYMIYEYIYILCICSRTYVIIYRYIYIYEIHPFDLHLHEGEFPSLSFVHLLYSGMTIQRYSALLFCGQFRPLNPRQMCINKLLGKFNQLFHQNHQMSNLRKINNSPWEGPPLMFAALSYPIKTLLCHLPKKSKSKLAKLCLHYILSQFYQHFTSIFSILPHFPSGLKNGL